MAVTHSRRKGPVCELLKDEYRGYEMTGFNRKFGLPGRLVLLGALAAALLLLGGMPVHGAVKYLTQGSYIYSVNRDGSAAVHRYQGTARRVVIPEILSGRRVTKIDSKFLQDTSSEVTSVVIPASVTTVSSDAFRTQDGSLTSVSVSAGNTKYSAADGVLFDKGKATLIFYPTGKKGDSYEIPQTVTAVGARAFQNASQLETVTLPSGLRSIGTRAFAGCRKMETPEFPGTVQSIGKFAFSGCGTIDFFTAPKKLTSIGYGAFSGCTGLKTLKVTGSAPALKIDGQAFFGCTALDRVTFSDRVTSIGDSAFFGCTALTEVTVPDTVTSLGLQALGYATDEAGTDESAVTGFLIVGKKGSAADTYAKSSRLLFRNVFNGAVSYYDAIPDQVTLKSLTRGVATLTVKYGKVPQAGAKYQIGLKQKGKAFSWTYTDMGTVRSKKFTKLQEWKTYYVKVRAYRVSHGKRYYGAWSSPVASVIVR